MRWSSRLRPGSVRGRLTLTLAVGALVLTVALVTGFNLFLRAGLGHDADSLLKARASAALASIAIKRGHVVVREAPNDAAIDRQLWVFAGGRLLEQPPEPALAHAGAARAARMPRHFADVPSLDLRLYSLPIVKGGRRLGTLVAGESLGPYEHTAARALAASALFGALVLAAILAFTRGAIAA